MSFRSHRSGKRHPITARGSGQTIFHEPESKGLAKDVHAESVSDARESTRKLEKDFDSAKTRDAKVHIERATVEEANRLEIGSNNPNNGPEARLSLREREKVFRSASDRMHNKLFDSNGAFIEDSWDTKHGGHDQPQRYKVTSGNEYFYYARKEHAEGDAAAIRRAGHHATVEPLRP